MASDDVFEDSFDKFDPETGGPELDGEPTQPGASAKQGLLDKLTAGLPAGGGIILWSREEVDLFEETCEHYSTTFNLIEHNDMLAVGGIAQTRIEAYRAQQMLNNRVPDLDEDGDPRGRYITRRVTETQRKDARKTFNEALKAIREAEQALGVDKRTRDAAGAQSEAAYIDTLKAAARARGVHIAERTLAYERMAMDARRRLRILRNADDEDKRYSGITAESICLWMEDELAKLEQVDKDFASQQGKVAVGRKR